MTLQPSRRSTSEIITQMRPRGLFASIRMSLLQPILFFRTLSVPQPESRQWLWMAIALLLVAGVVAIRQNELRATPNTPGAPVVPPGGEGGPVGEPPPTEALGAVDPAENLTLALIGGSTLLLSWLAVMVLLAVVSLARGVAPSIGINLQVAIWASGPFLLMGVIQLLWYGSGGAVGKEGISGLLPEAIQNFDTWSPFARDFVFALFSRLTIFWVWNLALIYLGARYALRGSRVTALFVVVVWALLYTLIPIASGAIKAPLPPLPEQITLPEAPPPDSETPPTPEGTAEPTAAPTAEATVEAEATPEAAATP